MNVEEENKLKELVSYIDDCSVCPYLVERRGCWYCVLEQKAFDKDFDYEIPEWCSLEDV